MRHRLLHCNGALDEMGGAPRKPRASLRAKGPPRASRALKAVGRPQPLERSPWRCKDLRALVSGLNCRVKFKSAKPNHFSELRAMS